MSTITKNDIELICESMYVDFESLRDKNIIVTGATGMIASVLIMSLLKLNEAKSLNIVIFALARDKKKFDLIFEGYESKNLIFKEYNILNKISNIEEDIDYIIHTANTTSSQDFVSKPVEVISQIIEGTKNILDFAKAKEVESLVYLSSMEAYGQFSFEREGSVKEEEYGYIDILNERSSYSQGKRMAETLCYSYFKEYDVPVKIARLVQTLGANVDYKDNRVFAYFARNIVENKDIILRTEGKTVTSRCYITDAITAIFKILLSGENGQAYNVANKESALSIKEMATMLCNIYKTSSIKIEKNEQTQHYPPETKLVVDTSKLESLNWQAQIKLEEMFDKIIENFKSVK